VQLFKNTYALFEFLEITYWNFKMRLSYHPTPYQLSYESLMLNLVQSLKVKRDFPRAIILIGMQINKHILGTVHLLWKLSNRTWTSEREPLLNCSVLWWLAPRKPSYQIILVRFFSVCCFCPSSQVLMTRERGSIGFRQLSPTIIGFSQCVNGCGPLCGGRWHWVGVAKGFECCCHHCSLHCPPFCVRVCGGVNH